MTNCAWAVLVSLGLSITSESATQPASSPTTRSASQSASRPAIPDAPAEAMDVPVIDGDWWKIADNAPDVSPYNTRYHNACDFSIWPAADGIWQMAACIRETSFPGGTRLFYHWEANGSLSPK